MKVFIFDMDGTFIDSMDFWNNLMIEYLESIGIEPDPDLPAELVSFTLKEGISYTKEKYNIKDSEEEIHKDMLGLMAYNYENTFDIEPSAIEIFKHLKEQGHKVVVATATQRSLTDIVLKRFDLEKWLDLVVVSDEVSLHKGDPQYFKDIANYFGVNPKNCIVVEDALYAIESAREVGMNTVAITYQAQRSHLDEIKRKATIYGKNLTEVRDYFIG